MESLNYFKKSCLKYSFALLALCASPHLFSADEVISIKDATNDQNDKKAKIKDLDALLQERLTMEDTTNPFQILLHKPNYIMLYNNNYTHKNNYGLADSTLKSRKGEIKFQISFKKSIFDAKNYFDKDYFDIFVGYTQLSFWQAYVKSAYFRESDYSPEIFLTSNVYKNLMVSTGLNHESNGRGGLYERSWNRVYMDFSISKYNYYLSVTPWILVFKSASTKLHNPDIRKYMGNEAIVLGYKDHLNMSVKLRNIERADKYLTVEALISYPIKEHINLTINAFNGYGQNLIEYNKRSTTLGIGFSLNNYL